MFSGLLQPMHLLVILGIVLIVFGPGKLSSLGRDLGKSMREFKDAMEERNVTPPSPEVAASRPAPVESATAGPAGMAAEAVSVEKNGA